MTADFEKYMKQLKVWNEEVRTLHMFILKTKLSVTIKWNQLCYCNDESNIVIIQPFKKCLALMFFKGALLKDEKNLLIENGPNSVSSKRLEFSTLEKIKAAEPIIKKYIKEAIAIESAGLKNTTKPKPTILPAELKAEFSANPKLKVAFFKLTPGRQRAYLLHFSSAKQAETRIARIKKYAEKILSGLGFND